jgi:uncharacterized membrane protein YcaP (DUF421 family)
MFFDSWHGLLRIAVVGTLAYLSLVVILRVTGKRTLSKLNAFDFVITVAFGSVLATILLNETVALAEGVLALLLLALLQYAVAWLNVRSVRFRRFTKSEPRLVMHDGEFLRDAMAEERLTEDEIIAALRASGVAHPGARVAVVIETNGDLSVLGATPDA